MVDPETPLPYGDPWQESSLPVPSSVPPPVSPYGITSPYPATTPYPAAEPVIAHIGEIQVTSSTVRTPPGQFPLRGSQWPVTDQWTAVQKIPACAVLLAILTTSSGRTRTTQSPRSVASSRNRSVCQRSSSSVSPLNVLPSMTKPPVAGSRAPRCRLDSQPRRRPCPHSAASTTRSRVCRGFTFTEAEPRRPTSY